MASNILFLFLTTTTFIGVFGMNDIYTVETEYVKESDGANAQILLSRTNTSYAENFKYEFFGGPATVGVDYLYAGTPIPATFPSGSATFTIIMTVVDDGIPESNEFFRIRLSEFSTSDTAMFNERIDIMDNTDISLGCPTFLRVNENSLKMTLRLTRNAANRFGALTVTVEAKEATAVYVDSANPSFVYELAEDGTDFTAFSEDVVYANNESGMKTVEIEILDDVNEEEWENFVVTVRGTGVQSCDIPALINDDDRPRPYHCARDPSQPCVNGTCDRFTGGCTCNSGYGGPDCSLVPGPQPGCDNRCGAGGWCISDGAAFPTITCKCKPGFAGEFCNYTAYHHQCNINSFGICIDPYGDFQGSIYVLGKRDVNACNLVEVDYGMAGTDPRTIPGVQDWCQGHFIKLDYNGTASGAVCGDFTSIQGDLSIHTAQLIVEYSNTIGPLDELVTLNCVFNTSSSLVTSELIEYNTDPRFIKKYTATKTRDPVVVTVTRYNDAPINGPIPLFAVFKVCASVEEALDFNCIALRHIYVNNTYEDGTTAKVTTFQDGCQVGGYTNTYVEGPYWPGPGADKVCYTMRTFTINGNFNGNTILMGLELVVKVDNTPSCAHIQCNKRKKRSTEEEYGGFVVLEIDTTMPREQVVESAPVRGTETEAADLPSTSVEGAEPTNYLPLIVGCTLGGAFLLASAIAIGFVASRRHGRKQHPEMY